MTKHLDELRNIRPDIQILSETKPVSFENAWYDVIDPNHFWINWRNKILINNLHKIGLNKNKELKVLEIGCGHAVARLLVEDSTSWIVDAADINPYALKESLPGKGKTLLYDIFDLSPEMVGKYDAIILFDVIEHIENPKEFIDIAVKYLQEDGIIFINVPALQSLYSAFDQAVGHYRRYNKSSLITELRSISVSKSHIQYWGFSMLPILISRTILMSLSYKKVDINNSGEITQKGVTAPNVLIDVVLKLLMHLETKILKSPPLGTSVFYAGKIKN